MIEVQVSYVELGSQSANILKSYVQVELPNRTDPKVSKVDVNQKELEGVLELRRDRNSKQRFQLSFNYIR